MYNQSDKEAAIREIQRYLYTISQIEKTIPYLAIDGIFGDETKNAVREFQRLKRLPETGSVDNTTFDALYKDYVNILEARNQTNKIFNISLYPLNRGDSGSNVSIINSLISDLAKYYDIPNVPSGDFFNEDTENAIRSLERIFLFNESGSVSYPFEIRMKNELKFREKFFNFLHFIIFMPPLCIIRIKCIQAASLWHQNQRFLLFILLFEEKHDKGN